MKIGIMSDSHGDRRAIDRALERAGKVDFWLHAGDCVPDAAYLGLVSAKRVENVAGNTDWTYLWRAFYLGNARQGGERSGR